MSQMGISGEYSFMVPSVIAEDIIAIADPTVKCENALCQAPFVISSLGHLLLISAQKDFSLIDNPSENANFKHLRYAHSFRACLVQLSNDVWGAFNKAHISMERIRLKSLSIREDVKIAVKFIKEGSENELSIVYNCLEAIDKKSEECVTVAKEITDKFKFVAHTMNELLEACISAKGRYDTEQKESESAREAAAEKKKHIEKSLYNMKERCDEGKHEVERAKKDHEIAINSYPSTWKIILCKSVDEMAHFARDITVSLIPVFLLPVGLPTSSTSRTTPKKEDPVSPTKPTMSDEEAMAYLAASDILKHAELLLNFSNNDQNGIETAKEWFQEKLEELRESSSDAVSLKNAKKLSQDGVERCQDILKCLKMPVNVDGNAAIGNLAERWPNKVTKNRCKQFHADAVSFNEEATKALSNLDCNVNDDVPKPNGGGLTTILLQNAEQKRQEAFKIWSICYERYERCQEKMQQEERERDKVLDALAKFDHRNLDLDKIRDTLCQGMKALGKVIENWKQFQQMFHWLRTVISEEFRPSLRRIHEIGGLGIQNNAQILKESLTKETIIEEADKAIQMAFVVQSVSALYVDVSQSFLLNEMNSLQKVVSYDAERDREEMEDTRRGIEENCNRMLDGIKKLVKERRKNMLENILKQQENIGGPSG